MMVEAVEPYEGVVTNWGRIDWETGRIFERVTSVQGRVTLVEREQPLPASYCNLHGMRLAPLTMKGTREQARHDIQ